MSDYPDVILIIIDALRKDFSHYLEKRIRKEGFISYNNVITPSPWTMPSHASIFTGLYPIQHGAHETKDRKDFNVRLRKHDILSTHLKKLGYKTFLLSANPHINPMFGFIGFDHFYYPSSYDTPTLLTKQEEKIIKNLKRIHSPKSYLDFIRILMMYKKFGLSIKSIIDSSLKLLCLKLKGWPKEKGASEIFRTLKMILSSFRNEPKFIFINLIEVHEPYFTRDPIDVKKLVLNHIFGYLDYVAVKKWVKGYSRQVRIVTEYVLRIIKLLRQQGILDRTLVIITSDHGQLLGEHGKIGHGDFLYDELLYVPLLIKYPKDVEIKIERTTKRYVSLTKIRPFILNLVKAKLTDDNILYSNVVFAESYGLHLDYKKYLKNLTRKDLQIIEGLEKHRIAIYFKQFKGIFNVTDWKFEVLKSYDKSSPITEEIIEYMKGEIVKLLKITSKIRSLKSRLTNTR